MNRTFALVAPYVAWMVLMTLLPQTAWAYAVRGLVTVALLPLGFREIRPCSLWGLGWGLLAGIGVFIVWIAPETWLGFGSTPLAAESSPYAPVTCGWALTLIKLAASAFVISIAEELFFRRWLVEFAGFWWMVALFAVEHGNRWFVGALTGICYGYLAKRFGLLAAIVAHAVTNLVLGLYVIFFDQWVFW